MEIASNEEASTTRMASGVEEEAHFTAPKWVQRLYSIPSGATSSLYGVAGVALGAMFALPEWWILVAGVIGVTLLVVGILLENARERRTKEVKESRIRALRDQYTSQLNDLKTQYASDASSYIDLIDELAGAGFMVVESVKDNKADFRKRELPKARYGLLSLVRNRLGPPEGVRACLFTVSEENPSELITGGSWGQNGRTGPPSDRVFKAGEKTFDLAMAKLPRFVEYVGDLDTPPLRPFLYETFAAHPVSTDEYLFGILTIDAPARGDLTERDVSLLAAFAGLMTITFAVDKDARKIERGNQSFLCDNKFD